MMRRSMMVAGLGVLGVAWGLLPRLPTPPFATHMAQHMAVVALAAPLLALGLASTRLDPVERIPRLASPVLASAIELVLVWAWHAPRLHHAARHLEWARGLEQGSFLAAGLYLWISVVGGSAVARRRRAVAGVAGLLLTSMHMTLLGALIMLAPRLLFGHHGATSWLSPLHDQQLGGALMIVLGAVAYLVGGLAVAMNTMRSQGRALEEGRP